MTPVRSADRRNARCMSRYGKPIVNRRTDSTTVQGRIAGTMVSGDQEHQALAGGDRLLKATVDGTPCRIEIHSVHVQNAVRLDVA